MKNKSKFDFKLLLLPSIAIALKAVSLLANEAHGGRLEKDLKYDPEYMSCSTENWTETTPPDYFVSKDWESGAKEIFNHFAKYCNEQYAQEIHRSVQQTPTQKKYLKSFKIRSLMVLGIIGSGQLRNLSLFINQAPTYSINSKFLNDVKNRELRPALFELIQKLINQNYYLGLQVGKTQVPIPPEIAAMDEETKSKEIAKVKAQLRLAQILMSIL